jgi:hypothetical protein
VPICRGNALNFPSQIAKGEGGPHCAFHGGPTRTNGLQPVYVNYSLFSTGDCVGIHYMIWMVSAPVFRVPFPIPNVNLHIARQCQFQLVRIKHLQQFLINNLWIKYIKIKSHPLAYGIQPP